VPTQLLCHDAEMLTATATLARRIEAAEATLIAGMGRAVAARLGPSQVIVMPLGKGAAVMPGPGSQLSKVAGLGFEPIDEAALAAVEREFGRFKTAVRVELSSLADPSVARLLSRRGYALAGFENVLGLPLPWSQPADGSAAIELNVVAQTGADNLEEWAAVVRTGFSHPDTFDGPSPIEVTNTSGIDLIFRDLASLDGFSQYVARRGGRIAGGASMRIDNGVAQLCGAATLPEFRRPGVQTALVRARLAHAAEAGCDVAVVTTEPASKSQANAQREGFELLYVRAVLIKSA
jgi:ribosomal protein S18 acetylase RimI-like enzyme